MAVSFAADPNQNEDEQWIEYAAISGYGFRIWHLMLFCFIAVLGILILICCCIKLRIPRTKQQIEADYRRKKLARKFRERLRLIHNQEMDALDLHRALEMIQEDYKMQSKNLTDNNDDDDNNDGNCKNKDSIVLEIGSEFHGSRHNK